MCRGSYPLLMRNCNNSREFFFSYVLSEDSVVAAE